MSQMDSTARARQAAGAQAAAAIEARPGGTLVGLGTGDTASYFIRALAERAAQGEFAAGGLRCVATSLRSAELAQSLGLEVIELDAVDALDVTVDGADEVDPELRLLKGAGGALLFEKLVAHCSRELVILCDDAKLVPYIGAKRLLPIEIVPFGAAHTEARLRALPGIAAVTRRMAGETAYRTDGGHYIVDAQLDAAPAPAPAGVGVGVGAGDRLSSDDRSPEALHDRIKAIAGVVETGLFCREASRVLVGGVDGAVRVLSRAAR